VIQVVLHFLQRHFFVFLFIFRLRVGVCIVVLQLPYQSQWDLQLIDNGNDFNGLRIHDAWINFVTALTFHETGCFSTNPRSNPDQNHDIYVKVL